MLQQELIETVNNLYGISVDSVNRIESGFLSRNLILGNKTKKFFLKQYRFNNQDRIKEIHNVKVFFSRGGIPVILPIEHKENSFYFEFEGYFFSLFPYVEGNIIVGGLPFRALESAARMLARIHLLSKNGYPQIIREHYTEWDSAAFINEAENLLSIISAKKRKTAFDKLALKSVQFKTSLVKQNTVTYSSLHLLEDHIIHGDYHRHNLFFDEFDEIKAVFDLEKSKIAPRVYEVARSLDFMCLDNDNEEIGDHYFNNAHTFLTSYNSLYPLSRDELVHGIKAYYFDSLHSLWVEKEHYLKKNYRLDPFLEFNLLSLEYFSQHLNEYIDKVTNNLPFRSNTA